MANDSAEDTGKNVIGQKTLGRILLGRRLLEECHWAEESWQNIIGQKTLGRMSLGRMTNQSRMSWLIKDDRVTFYILFCWLSGCRSSMCRSA